MTLSHYPVLRTARHWFLFLLPVFGCKQKKPPADIVYIKEPGRPYISVLGIAQDAGYPQAGCRKSCCASFYRGDSDKKHVSSLALVDPLTKKYWIFDAGPDFGSQLHQLQQTMGVDSLQAPAGIFLTHAHIGHYTGLMQLGREVMGTSRVPVYAMPRMDSFLRNNGPWSQLVKLDNISIRPMQADSPVVIADQVSVTPILVPHRDEYSETVGFLIKGPQKSVLFIPDIDKWEKWDRDILALIRQTDAALLDGTFFRNGELPGRDMKEIPHPFIEESLQKFSFLTSAEKARICFIHFNHTNPLIKRNSPEKEQLLKKGFTVAEEGMNLSL